MNSRLRILQLEDDPTDAEIILLALKKEGFFCVSERVETEESYLNAIRTRNFDLILADRSLPGFDGFSALRSFVALSAGGRVPAEPFIFVSGTMGEETAIEALKSGATDYVLKDRMARLGPVVRRALGEAAERVARERAEEERAQADSMFRGLFDNMATGVAIVGLDGRIIQANGALQSMLGYGAAELRGVSLASLTYTEDAAEGLPASECGEEPQSCGLERRYLRKDGAILWGRVNVSLLKPQNQAASASIHLIEDITSERQQRQKLLEAQKMEVVGRLAAGIAHDFNNILTVINGHCRQLLDRLPVEDPVRRELGEIQLAGSRAAHLTQRLLAFSRLQVTRRTVLDLNSIITELRPFLLRILREDITLTTKLDPELDCIEADQTEIEQVITNLVINARDAMRAGGELTIATGKRRVGIALADSQGPGPAEYVDLVVTDNGHGMDEATKSRMFEPFFTTKEVGHGTGLGLWMVQEFMERSHGVITVESEIGHGASFRLSLPRLVREAGVALARPDLPAGQAPLGGSETIIVVGEEIATPDSVSSILKSAGYRVLLARDAVETRALSEREVGPVHLVITEISSPGVGERNLSAFPGTRSLAAKVLCLSDSLGPVLAEQRAAGYLQKPFSSRALLQRVRDILDTPSEVTILIVDDDPSIRGFLGDILRPIGYLVVEASSGTQALHQLRETKIDLVITDLIMPDQEGLEVIPIIRKDFPNVRLLAISGGFGAQFLQIAEMLGAHATLQKPFTADTVKDVVRCILGRDRHPTGPGSVAQIADAANPVLELLGAG